jgi:alpha-L-fucosidase
MTDEKQAPTPEPRIARFEQMAFGLFLHWGLYSQVGKGEWIMHLGAVATDEYAKLTKTFTAADFDVRAIARTARQAGMRYITLTARHHDGFSLYDTRGLTDFDAPHSAANRDLIAEFIEGCRAEDITPFLYHTTLDWKRQSHTCSDAEFDEYLDFLHASVEVLCTHYGPLGGLWFDGDWSRPQADWKRDRLYGIIRGLQPEAMIINNTGLHDPGAIGHPEIDSVTYEQATPKPVDRRGLPKHVAGEMCQTINAHWGIGANDFNYKSTGQLIEFLCHCRHAGANYLLNVGPTAQGALPELETALLKRLGQWVDQHATPVYQGNNVDVQCQGQDFVLEAEGKWYYFVFNLGVAGHDDVTTGLTGTGPRALKGVQQHIKSARWMDSSQELTVIQDVDKGLASIDLTGFPYGSNLVVRVAELDLGA